MRPPICAVCESSDGAELVAFARTEEDEEWHRRAEAESLVGHPPDLEWFCARHLAPARRLVGFPREQALRHLLVPHLEEIGCAPVDALTLYRLLVDVVPFVVAALGVPAPELTERTWRDWSPMDGAVPPNCPYVDHRATGGGSDGVEVAIRYSNAQYSDEDHSNTLVAASAAAGDRHFGIYGGERATEGRPTPITALHISVDLTDDLRSVVELIVRRIGELSRM